MATFNPTVYVSTSGSNAIAGSVFLTAAVFAQELGTLFREETRRRSSIRKDLLLEELNQVQHLEATKELSVEEIKESSVNVLVNQALDSLVAKLCLRAQIFGVPTVLTSDPENLGHYSYPVSLTKRCPELVAANMIAFSYFREHILKYDEIYPVYDWKNNSGRVSFKHRLGLLKEGMSPLHRNQQVILQLGKWLLTQVERGREEVYPYLDYLYSEPPWWSKSFPDKRFLPDQLVVLSKDLPQTQYSEKVRKWSIENAPP